VLSFSVYFIAHYPNVKKKMSEEIDNIFQGEKMRPITKDNFYSLDYRKSIVKEVTRVIPIVHSFVR
jgi:cytochrome P450